MHTLICCEKQNVDYTGTNSGRSANSGVLGAEGSSGLMNMQNMSAIYQSYYAYKTHLSLVAYASVSIHFVNVGYI